MPNGSLYVANNPASGQGSISAYAPAAKTATLSITQGINGPFAVALDTKHQVYVANTFGSTVTVYASGAVTPLRTITTIAQPIALAFDPSGNLYVAGASEVGVFAPGSTKALRTFSGGHNNSVAVDGAGYVYIGRTGSPGSAGAVSVYNPNATTLDYTIALESTCEVPGQIGFAAGDVYILAKNCSNNPTQGQVEVYDPATKAFLRTITSGVYEPVGMGLDASGTVFVANELSKSGAAAGNVTEYAAGSTSILRSISDAALTGGTRALTVDGAGNVYAAASSAVVQFAPGGTTPVRTIDEGVDSPDAIVLQATPVPTPTPTLPPLVYVLDCPGGKDCSVSGFAQGQTKATLGFSTGVTDNDAGSNLAFDGAGNVYVPASVLAGGEVLEFAPGSHKLVRTFKTNDERVNYVAVDAKNNVYATCFLAEPKGNCGVTVWRANGTRYEITKGITSNALGLAIDNSGNLYVAQTGSDYQHAGANVTVYAPGGTSPIRTYDTPSGYCPCQMTFDPSGNLYVALEAAIGEVIEYKAGSTKIVRTIKSTSGESNQLDPVALVSDDSGTLYVANPSYDNVTIYAPGSTTPERTLRELQANSLAVDNKGYLYVDDVGVLVYAPDATTRSYTLSGVTNVRALAFCCNR